VLVVRLVELVVYAEAAANVNVWDVLHDMMYEFVWYEMGHFVKQKAVVVGVAAIIF